MVERCKKCGRLISKTKVHICTDTSWNKGKQWDDETKSKMREAKIGKKLSPEHREKVIKTLLKDNPYRFKKGSIPKNKGIPHKQESIEKIRTYKIGKKASEETRKKMHDSAKKGKDSKRWKGGITDDNKKARQTLEYFIRRNEVYKRDLRTCRLCWKKCNNKEIVAHHLKLFSEFPELRYSVDNGITLCRGCHINLHRKFEDGGRSYN